MDRVLLLDHIPGRVPGHVLKSALSLKMYQILFFPEEIQEKIHDVIISDSFIYFSFRD